jgi:uncharacterized membrane protein YjfL (UPF0719 family)
VRNNYLFAIVRSGVVIGQAIAMSPLLSYRSNPWWESVLWQLGFSLWVLVLFALLYPVLERLVKRAKGRVDNVLEASLAIALVQAAFYVAFGLVIGAALAGLGALQVTYWGLGGLPVFRWKLEGGPGEKPQHGRTTLNDAVRNGNVAAAFLSAGMVLGLGLALRSAIAGDFTSWATSIIGFVVVYLAAVASLCVSVLLLDKFVITNATIQDVVCENHVVSAAIMSMLMVSASLGVTSLVV